MEQQAALAAGRPGRPRGASLGVRRKAAAELDPLIRAGLDAAPAGLVLLDNERRVRLVSRAASALLGVGLAPRNGATHIMRLLAQSPWLDAAALQTLAAAFNGVETDAPRQVLLSIPGADEARVVAMDLRRAGAAGWVASLTDVTRARETQDWLVEHASTDPITGLWNRQHFMLMLQDRLDGPQADGTVILLLDLKRFKPVNETLGSAAGDTLLRLVGGRLAGFVRESDLLARFASDDFAIMLGERTDRDAVTALSGRLAELIAQPFVIEGQTISIGAHVGVACAPQDGDTPDILVANAGLALSAARAETRGHLRFFEPRLDEEARRRRALEADLRQARARGELELHYQPQIEMKRQTVIGFEALLRWRSPTRGLVPPNHFIPIAERIGLIGDIGEWVLRAACREAMGWPEDITVAVNASPLQVEAGGFDGVVARALRETKLPARRLEIEITENLLLRDNGTVTSTFKALQDMGVGLVLDDFGTGYASLSQLARFHFDKIKIDRSFISSPDAPQGHQAIVRAIAALGVSLGVPTTAEGVETEEQLERVRDDGCTAVQGYFYSKPVPAGAVPDVLTRLNRREVAPATA
ncbi:MAG TPA: bifunctional diguanylate cyclase/phosphodiesterase [Acetobacteraceae bacterium]|nr:bifunctional diguanylate cyclase/phosphodiesterase [Acetobacteraceae bacterium]